ncbi:Hypothetical predicted protein [Olea europaea subsp. europaea]|uniref:Uncharacterized protein n=1 Tax=Olea europaea subsp. europaea TaxID=158383 RepID=A0A8S0RAJ1_OLEEU|nr:Hypothetical predicted protein [Olea europaea subsp. europaea]
MTTAVDSIPQTRQARLAGQHVANSRCPRGSRLATGRAALVVALALRLQPRRSVCIKFLAAAARRCCYAAARRSASCRRRAVTADRAGLRSGLAGANGANEANGVDEKQLPRSLLLAAEDAQAGRRFKFTRPPDVFGRLSILAVAVEWARRPFVKSECLDRGRLRANGLGLGLGGACARSAAPRRSVELGQA